MKIWHLPGATEPGASWDPESSPRPPPHNELCSHRNPLALWEAACQDNIPLPGLPGFPCPYQRKGVITFTQELKKGFSS